MSSWHLEGGSPIELEGEWEFYWNQLIDPQDFKKTPQVNQFEYSNVPRPWNGVNYKGQILDGDGYATFRLKLNAFPKQDFYAVKLIDLATAYTMWINGKVVMKNGVVGKSREEMTPQYFSQTAVIQLLKGKNTIVVQISNFYHKKGGFWYAPVIGLEPVISRIRERLIIFDIFLFGTLIVIGFYHFGIYLMRRKEVTALLFSLVSFMGGIRVVLTGERIFNLVFPGIGWEIFLKAEHLTVYLSIPLFYLFLMSLFPEFSKLLGKALVFMSLSFAFLTLVTPGRVFSHAILYFQAILIFYIVYTIITLIRIMLHKRESSYWVFLGAVIVVSTVFHDILVVNNIIYNTQLSPFGFFLFILLQSFMLSLRLAKSYSNVENIYKDLAKSNKAKDELLGALTVSEKKFRDLVENIDEVLFILDSRGKIIYASPSLEKVTGYKSGILINNIGRNFIYSEDFSEVLRAFNLVLEGNEQQLSCRILTKWESTRWVQFNLRPNVENDEIIGIRGLMTDITDQKEARELMVQTEKMMSVGGLAAGMAHEINNPLGAIIQAAQVIKRRLFSSQHKNEEKAAKYSINLPQLANYLKEQKVLYFLEGIQEAGKRAAAIIDNMLQFSRKSESLMKTIDLVHLTEKTIELANNSYDLEKKIDFKRVKVITEFDLGPHIIFCSETQIKQVMLNLLINAAQALFSQQARIIPTITIRIKKEDEFERIEIEDNGPGMDEQTQKRVFEPFYTTKPVGKGTGLGLSVSYMIITNNHLGKFEVESLIGKGTKFTIWLPNNKQRGQVFNFDIF